MANGPIGKYKAGGVIATIWENKGNYGGKDVVNYSITAERTYKDKDGNWKKTSSFGMNDLPKLVLVANRAYAKLAMKEEEQLETGDLPSSNLNIKYTNSTPLKEKATIKEDFVGMPPDVDRNEFEASGWTGPKEEVWRTRNRR